MKNKQITKNPNNTLKHVYNCINVSLLWCSANSSLLLTSLSDYANTIYLSNFHHQQMLSNLKINQHWWSTFLEYSMYAFLALLVLMQSYEKAFDMIQWGIFICFLLIYILYVFTWLATSLPPLLQRLTWYVNSPTHMWFPCILPKTGPKRVLRVVEPAGWQGDWQAPLSSTKAHVSDTDLPACSLFNPHIWWWSRW